LLHVLTCQASSAKTFRSNQQQILWKQLELINTPDEVQQAIQSGILHLEQGNPTHSTFSNPVSAAYQAQQLLGWEPFLRGRISSSWRIAFSGEDTEVNSKQCLKWAGQLVGHLLNYSQQLWVFRCGVIHGHTIEENRQRHKEELQSNVRAAYDEYSHDPFCVSHDWRNLFSKSVDLLLTSDRDTLTCWLRSFSEARQLQDLASLHQASQAKHYFFQLEKPATSSLLAASSTFPATTEYSTDDSSESIMSDDTSWSVSEDYSMRESDSDSDSSIMAYNPFRKSGPQIDVAGIPIEELDTG
jgi:hypothetical protein